MKSDTNFLAVQMGFLHFIYFDAAKRKYIVLFKSIY